ncbi:unnamed protein product [Soboliphyme baturini]|uniref:Hyaluronoglucosaminidase n=1 Tax=Soboliphyme baturini TaxID=241478 RepID=A0A183IBH0_9BILA|nr:unnamed protein product [Soboliphyme baturini]
MILPSHWFSLQAVKFSYIAMAERWISGVIEGFYGRPWTTEQRKRLFHTMQELNLNTYVYAPKDDLKHRVEWRSLYTVEESDNLQSIIEEAKRCSVDFCYALSPGYDIVYSSHEEVNLIKKKFEQVKNLGCESFSLLFDDIEESMSDSDKQKFTSFAQAQVSLTNQVYDYLGQPKFSFCPTEYCSAKSIPSLDESDYLHHIGQKLLPGIHIFWTGE